MSAPRRVLELSTGPDDLARLETLALDPHDGTVLFSRDYEPVFRLLVVGHDPSAIAIASLGAQVGFETMFLLRHPAPEPPLPLVRLLVGRPADKIPRLDPDRHASGILIVPQGQAIVGVFGTLGVNPHRLP